MKAKRKYFRTSALAAAVAVALVAADHVQAATSFKTASADRAVDIARQSRSRIEVGGRQLNSASEPLFREFAERTVALQQLIDARRQLQEGGFLAKGDPDGDARRAHINAKILMEVGGLKKACDGNLDGLLLALDNFDNGATASLIDTQATRSINSNYEVALKQYLSREKARFDEAAAEAQETLQAYESATDERRKKRLLAKYSREKRRMLRVDQRRRLYETRMQVATMNQKIAAVVREKIRSDGGEVSTRFRDLMAELYTVFSKVTPVAEVGGTDPDATLANIGFANLERMKETLDLGVDSVRKLSNVLDDMVNEVISGFGEIEMVTTGVGIGESLSVEEEMAFIAQSRAAWASTR